MHKTTQGEAEVNVANGQGFTPLCFATTKGNLESVEQLLKQDGIEVNQGCGKYNETPLHYAAYYGHLEVVKLLLKQEGINVNATNNNDETPLNIAQKINDSEVEEIFLIDNYAHRLIKEDIEYSNYAPYILAFVMGSHKRLGDKIALSEIPEEHRTAVQERYNELQKENTPASYYSAQDGTGILQKSDRQI